MKKNIKIELSKVFGGIDIYVCALMSFAFCLFTEIYENTMSGKKYSVLEAIITLSKDELSSNWQLCSREVIMKGTDGWISFFLPILVAFPCIPLVCDESKSGFLKFEIVRCKKMDFYMSKLIVSILCGSVTVMMGYLMFVIFVFFAFPKASELSMESKQLYQMMIGIGQEEMGGLGYLYYIIKKMACVFGWGGLNALPAIFLSCISKNKYVITCIPFFLKYAMSQFCQRIWQISTFAVGEKGMRLISSVVDPNAILHLNQYSRAICWKIAFYDLVIILLVGSVYLLIQSRRKNCDE